MFRRPCVYPQRSTEGRWQGLIGTSAENREGKMLGRLFVVAASVAVLAGPAAAFTLDGPPKIAWIYLNAKNDGGWQQAIEEARVKM